MNSFIKSDWEYKLSIFTAYFFLVLEEYFRKYVHFPHFQPQLGWKIQFFFPHHMDFSAMEHKQNPSNKASKCILNFSGSAHTFTIYGTYIYFMDGIVKGADGLTMSIRYIIIQWPNTMLLSEWSSHEISLCHASQEQKNKICVQALSALTWCDCSVHRCSWAHHS